MNKLQNNDFKNEIETGSAALLVAADKIYVTGLGLNKTMEEAVIAGDFGTSSSSPIVVNSAINSYDMAATLTNSLLRHQAESGVMYQLPTAVQGKKFFLVHEGINPTNGTILTVDSTNNKIDFNGGGTNYTATLNSATYNHGSSGVSGTLGTEIKARLEAVDGGATYTVTFSDSDKSYLVTRSTGTFYFRFATGPSIATSARKLMGFLAVDGSAAASQVGMSTYNEARLQPNTGDQIQWRGNLAVNPGYIAIRKKGVLIAITAIDATTWVVEQIIALTHIKNTTLGDVRELAIIGRDTWVTKATSGTARAYSSAFNLNNFGYVCNGLAGAVSNEVNQYNATLDSWTTKATGGTARQMTASFTNNGYGYICCGTTGSVSNLVDQYSDAANTWTAKTTITARSGLSAFAQNGYGYICDGSTGSVANTVNKYNDSANSWAVVATGGTARWKLGGFSSNGFGYIFGGDTGSVTNEVNQYNDSADTWITRATTGTARRGVAGFAQNGCGYSCDGYAATYSNEVNQYNDSYNAWISKATGGTAREGVTGFSVDGLGYICGGDTGVKSNEVNQYN